MMQAVTIQERSKEKQFVVGRRDWQITKVKSEIERKRRQSWCEMGQHQVFVLAWLRSSPVWGW